jgi:hypothetical protein
MYRTEVGAFHSFLHVYYQSQAWRTLGAEVPNCHTVHVTATLVDHTSRARKGRPEHRLGARPVSLPEKTAFLAAFSFDPN